MSDDKYPRVRRDEPYAGWDDHSHGAYKVVPADAIVIERGDDMNVRCITGSGGRRYWKHDDGNDAWDGRNAAELEQAARHMLARAEYLRTHPPVDEAEVQRLERLITQQPGWSVGSDHLARDLYFAGVRAPAEGVTK